MKFDKEACSLLRRFTASAAASVESRKRIRLALGHAPSAAESTHGKILNSNFSSNASSAPASPDERHSRVKEATQIENVWCAEAIVCLCPGSPDAEDLREMMFKVLSIADEYVLSKHEDAFPDELRYNLFSKWLRGFLECKPTDPMFRWEYIDILTANSKLCRHIDHVDDDTDGYDYNCVHSFNYSLDGVDYKLSIIMTTRDRLARAMDKISFGPRWTRNTDCFWKALHVKERTAMISATCPKACVPVGKSVSFEGRIGPDLAIYYKANSISTRTTRFFANS